METQTPGMGNPVPLVDLSRLGRTLDLWAATWDAREQQAFEKALARIVAGKGPRWLRLEALAACHIIATPITLVAAQRAADDRGFSGRELEWIVAHTLPLFRLHRQARRLRGHRNAVQLVLERYVEDPTHPLAGPLLDVIDLCDLYLVGQSAPGILALEAARRILSRGQHQQRRLARCLGVTLQELPRALVPPATNVEDDDYVEYQVG